MRLSAERQEMRIFWLKTFLYLMHGTEHERTQNLIDHLEGLRDGKKTEALRSRNNCAANS